MSQLSRSAAVGVTVHTQEQKSHSFHVEVLISCMRQPNDIAIIIIALTYADISTFPISLFASNHTSASSEGDNTRSFFSALLPISDILKSFSSLFMANRLVLQNLNACRTDKNVAPDITGALFFSHQKD
ncbi:hypothetical protein ETR_07791 [Erwinia tracheiphila PSU-1]|nr:hypothetical protein ETR_07791 [Erwinia tracheiphila PSU-1]